MGEAKRALYIFLGIVCMILALIGGILPIMPGTIFLVMSGICFAKGSERFNKWLISRKFYKKYLKKYMGKYIEKDLKKHIKKYNNCLKNKKIISCKKVAFKN